MKRGRGNESQEELLKNKNAHLFPALNIPTYRSSPEGLSNSRSPQVSAESVHRDWLNCDFKMNPSGPRSSGQKKPNCKADGTPASRRLSSPALWEPLRRRAPLPEPGRAQLAPCPRVGGNRSHKAPPARQPRGTFRRTPRGSRAFSAAAPKLHRARGKETAATSREREELGGAGAASVSPTANCRQRKRRYSRYAPCKHRDPEVGERSGGNAFPGTLPGPAPPPSPIGPSSTNRYLWKDVELDSPAARARILGTPDGFPGNHYLEARPAPKIGLQQSGSLDFSRLKFQVFCASWNGVLLLDSKHGRSDVLCVTFIPPR